MILSSLYPKSFGAQAIHPEKQAVAATLREQLLSPKRPKEFDRCSVRQSECRGTRLRPPSLIAHSSWCGTGRKAVRAPWISQRVDRGWRMPFFVSPEFLQGQCLLRRDASTIFGSQGATPVLSGSQR